MRSQPIRSPPQKGLLRLPTLIASGAYDANGAGSSWPSSASATIDSSTIAVVRVRASTRATCSRAASPISAPVGLWKSGIR